MKKKLKGGSLNIAEMNMAIYGQCDPDAPNLSAEQWQEFTTAAWPVLKHPVPVGRVIISGTAGEIDNKWDFKKIWEDGK